MDLCALILYLQIKECNFTFRLLLYHELDWRIQFIQVTVEFLQLLVSVGPDDKDIIDVPAAYLWFPEG